MVCFCLTSDVCLSRTSGRNSIIERPRKIKIGTEVAHVTCDQDTTFKVKGSKVKVTRPLYSPPCWRVRQLQRWAWERVGREKLLLRCRLIGRARHFGAHGGRRGAEVYRGGRPPTACLVYAKIQVSTKPKVRYKQSHTSDCRRSYCFCQFYAVGLSQMYEVVCVRW